MMMSQAIDLTTSIRFAFIAVLVSIIAKYVTKRVLQSVRFKRAIDKLPGPPVSNVLLGNIPSSVLTTLLCSTSEQQRKLAADFYTSQIQSLLGHTLIYQNEDLFRVWLGKEPVVCIWKPQIVEKVLGDNFLLEKSYHYDFLKPWLGNGLLTSPGRIWRSRRRLLVPSFHFNILQTFVPVFNKKSKILVKKLLQKLNHESSNSMNKKVTGNRQTIADEQEQKSSKKSIVVDITPVVTACALDAICETIMGVSVNAQDKSENDYCESVYIVGETFLERVIQPKYWIDFVFRQTELGKLYNKHLNKLHSFTRTVISQRKQNNLTNTNQDTTTQATTKTNITSNLKVLVDTKRPSTPTANDSDTCGKSLPKAFLDLLLNYKNANGLQTLSDEEIREEVDTFMFEGHDTTAMALSWTIFLLGHYTEVQQRLADEVNEYFADKACSFDFTADDDDNDDTDLIDEPQLDEIKRLKYLDCVVKEALRLCPSVPFIGRKTTSNMQLGEHNIPAGTVLFVLIYQLHRNSEIYPNPERFDPDRFMPHKTVGRHPFAYVPFSAGPRNCIGQKFAMAEMKMMLLNMVRNFKFESVTPLDKAKIQMEMVLRPKCRLDIRISCRS